MVSDLGEVSRLTGETLADLLRGYRTRAGLTQAALAERAGLSEQAISLLERGTRRRPRRDTLQMLGQALELAESELAKLTAAARHGQPRQPSEIAAGSAEISANRARESVLPRQLPPTLADFVGRTTELDALLALLESPEAAPAGATTRIAVTGMGGVGKTALAVHAAHLVADHYPDGHLYLDLRGYGPDEPLSPAEALGQLLRSVGLESESIPGSVDEAAALLRSRLAGRRVLMLLDNANGEGQVLPLVPGTPEAAVIVTSRQVLGSLPGFQQLSLSPLHEADAIDLLRRVTGRRALAPETAGLRLIAELAGHLPLAIRLIGARLAARPSWPVGHVVDRLKDERRRLDELSTGEAGVRASIAGSVELLVTSEQDLDRRAAAALGYLGLPNSTRLTLLTVAHLLDETTERTESVLERLVDLNLLMSVGPGRYHLHDLVKVFARERAHGHLSAGARDDALGRVLKFYTAVGWTCQRMTHKHSQRSRLAGTFTGRLPDFADAAASVRWIEEERSNIFNTLQQAAQTPALLHLVPELAMSLFGYFEARSRWTEMRTCLTTASEIARDLGLDRLGAWLEHDLAIPDLEHNILEPALIRLRRSLGGFESISDVLGQARCCSSLSYVLQRLGRLDEARNWAEQALSLSQELGDRVLIGLSYLALGNLHADRGDVEHAMECFERSIELAVEFGDQRSLAKRTQVAGEAALRAGSPGKAISYLQRAHAIFAEIGHESGVTESLQELAAANLAIGDETAARADADACIQRARAGGTTYREGYALIVRGKINAAAGDSTSARADWSRAAELLAPLSPRDEAQARELLDRYGIQVAEDGSEPPDPGVDAPDPYW